MANIKQYLENSWYRGASQDRQTGYAAQYQYGYGVNTRDMKNGVCLAGGATDSETQSDYRFIYFYNNSNLYTFNTNGEIADIDGTIKCTVTPSGANRIIFAETFGDDIYATIGNKIYKVDPGLWTSTDVTPGAFAGVTGGLLNYANTFLLCGSFDEVWKFDGLTRKKIRDFESGYQVMGLTQEGNYLKIYTSDYINTKVHYAKGTFDVEETGLVQTVTFKGLGLSAGDITYDQGNDYVIFEIESGECKLAKIQGYNKVDIRWTQTRGGQKIFTAGNPVITAADGVVFAAMDDGIRTFTEYNGWLWGGNCEFPIASNEEVEGMFRFGEKLYACIHNKTTNKYINRRLDMSFHPATYQSSGYIIGRVFDGGCGSLFKKNLQSTVTYNMPIGTSLELSYRYDRSSFGYDKSNFLSVKTMADTNSCYDIVVPTTDNDFNKARNYIEYRVDLLGGKYTALTITNADTETSVKVNGVTYVANSGGGTMSKEEIAEELSGTLSAYNSFVQDGKVVIMGDNTIGSLVNVTSESGNNSPILFEHNLLYNDSMRKYR